ncbi:hypothetical protein [Roseomonas chloroacetimidivorans]|jgi:hypothetical protein|uniref:hypothetical protein n=1 Tax=Roseomonas chloroacetimidivorans TaxID=1766656 RepID=UPI003C78B2D5
MSPEPTRAEQVLRRVREQQARVERQERLIILLEQLEESQLLPEALQHLALMRNTHRMLSDELRKVLLPRC